MATSSSTDRSGIADARFWGLNEALVFALALSTLVLGIVVERWLAIALGGLLLAVLLVSAIANRRQPDAPASPGVRRRVGEYWWLGVALPFGVGTWATFLYLAVRLRRPGQALVAGGYLGLFVVGVALNVIGGDEDSTLSAVATGLWCLGWGAGAIHAVILRRQIRASLDGDASDSQRDARSDAAIRSSSGERHTLRRRLTVTAVLTVGGYAAAWFIVSDVEFGTQVLVRLLAVSVIVALAAVLVDRYVSGRSDG